MTEQEMRIAVAESRGWMEVWQEGQRIVGLTPPNDTKTCHNRKYEVPNYPADVNGIQEAVSAERFKNQFFFLEYQRQLWRVVHGRDWTNSIDYQFSISMFEVINATAPQRCEAYLRVKGLWKESTPPSPAKTGDC